ncbi:MAG: bifunctional methylenetetrahydrofolate dehydrogenase/methenyltetrahydrofolate cyclohydrolase FolD [Candidatus Micrarchaeota archaeon]
MKLMNGKELAARIKNGLKAKIAGIGGEVGLSVVLVGEDPASKVYVSKKEVTCEKLGICPKNIKLPENTSEKELLDVVRKLNEDESVHGILVQLPLPKQISETRVIEAIDPRKDVDGLHPFNAGRLVAGEPVFVPCTPKGIMRLLEEYGVELKGKHAVVIGRSKLVGKPIAALLLNANATVTVCHSKTRDLSAVTKQADVLVVAAGKPKLVTAEMVKQGAVVVDVGINKQADGALVGDVDFDSVKEKASLITPVPGGVGPMTIAMLMENTVQAFEAQKK